MSDIRENLQKILSAVWGRDVRQAIHDSIRDCYEDGSAGSLDIIAREGVEELETTKATRVELAEETADRLAEVAVERNRIDNLISSGSDTGSGGDATKRTETVLFESSTPSRGVVFNESYIRSLEIQGNINNYDYIDILYGAFDKYNVITIKTSDIPAYVVDSSFIDNCLSWSEESIPTVSSSSNYRADFKMSKYSGSVLYFKFARWTIHADGNNYYTSEDGSLTTSSIGILRITGVKYEEVHDVKDAELSDVRVGADGTVYQTAGGAVRGQVGDITNRLNGIESNFGDEYDNTATYSVGDKCIHVGAWYRCNTAIETAEEWTAGHWDRITLDNIPDQVEQNAIDELNEQMSKVLTTSYDYSGNLADTTGVEKTGQYTDYVEFDLVGDGAYYSNPFARGINVDSGACYEVNLLDSNGDVITATKVSDSTTSTNITDNSKTYFEISGTSLTLHHYFANGNHQAVAYTLSATPVKVKYRTRWWDADKAQVNGFTYGYSSETYVPYSAPSKVYSPNTDFADKIKDYYISYGFIDKTLNVEGSAADAKAVGDELYDRKGITFETENGWIRPTNGNFISDNSNTATDYIPVIPGEVIRVNRPNLQDFTDNACYNASKQYVSGLDTFYNVNDITIPSGVYYVRFSDYNSGMVGFSVERTGLWTRIRDAIDGSGDEVEYRHLIEQSKYGSGVLTLLHFSDLHMDTSTMIYINRFRTKYAEFLDDVIQTGDVSNGFSDNWWALVNVGLGDCLGVIGNHEALGSSKNSATQQELYEKYIEPYISGWGVTQPTGVDDSTSEHYCANYYYKDYTSATIRLIVLDTQKWSSAQLSWFTDTLASARTAGYAVVVASHVLPGAVTITDCNFSARYFSGGNVVHPFPTDDAPLVTEDAVSAVNDFITAGGEFTIWIGGHEHADIFGVFTNYPNVTAYMIDKASIERETPGAARIRGEKNQHAFNIMSIMRGGKLIKIVRIGEDVDGMMRGKHVFCYNYNTKTVISQW